MHSNWIIEFLVLPEKHQQSSVHFYCLTTVPSASDSICPYCEIPEVWNSSVRPFRSASAHDRFSQSSPSGTASYSLSNSFPEVRRLNWWCSYFQRYGGLSPSDWHFNLSHWDWKSKQNEGEIPRGGCGNVCEDSMPRCPENLKWNSQCCCEVRGPSKTARSLPPWAKTITHIIICY